MSYNIRDGPTISHTHSVVDQEDAKSDKLPHKPAYGRSNAGPAARRAPMSPTFHIDPERSSSSDNGSLGQPFQFPPQPSTFNPVRESLTTTHQSSSVYPAYSISSNSFSNGSPPSPSSPSSSSCFAPSIKTNGTGAADDLGPVPGFVLDPDDVSYRLRLLVKNNYFLPPAHSKPSQSDLQTLAAAAAPTQISPPLKSTSFRDIFRVGLKPATLAIPPILKTVPHHAAAPRLRQVKSTNALAGRQLHTRKDTVLSSSTTSKETANLSLAAGGPQERRGRVVVIREKMDDLLLAAKEAERQERSGRRSEDGRGRGGDEDQNPTRRRAKSTASRRSQTTDDEFVVDPTDAVDLPSYSFQPQASAFLGLGLGVDSSLGAATLADQLPPSAATLGMTKEDMLWRKALLHQAVGLSMNQIPPPSTASSSPNSNRIVRKTPSGGKSGKGAGASSGAVAGADGSNAGISSVPAPSTGNASATSKPPTRSPARSPVLPIVENLPSAVVASTPLTLRKPQEKRSLGQHLTVDVHHSNLSQSPNTQSTTPTATPVSRLHPYSHSLRTTDSGNRSGAGPPSPVPLRSETPHIFPTEPLKPPPHRRPGTGDSSSSDPLGSLKWQYPVSEELETYVHRSSAEGALTRLTLFADGLEGRKRSGEQTRSKSPATAFPPTEAETIKKTLTKPLLSEQVADDDTERSSDYFTPGSESRSSHRRPRPSGDGPRKSYETAVTHPRRQSNSSSASEYSDQERPKSDGPNRETRRPRTSQESQRPSRPATSQTQVLTPISDVFLPGTGPHSADSGRPSYARSEETTNYTWGTNQSRDSHTNSYGSRILRASGAESRASIFSTSFGPRSSTHIPVHQRSATSPSLPTFPSTGSNLGLHSLDGVAGIDDAPLPDRPLDVRPSTAGANLGRKRTLSSKGRKPPPPAPPPLSYGRVPVGTSALITRRAKTADQTSNQTTSSNKLHVEVSAPSIASNSGGFRSAPALEYLPSVARPTSSFFDFEVSAWRSSDDEKERIKLSPPPHTDVDLATRSRVSSNTGTIVPNPSMGIYAAGDINIARRRDSMASFLSLHFPNSSNPYLTVGSSAYGDVDPAKPIANIPPMPATPATANSGGSSFLSALSSLSLGRLGGKEKEKDRQSIGSGGGIFKRRLSKPTLPPLPLPSPSGDLRRYAKSSMARSTPTLALSSSQTSDYGRRSNVSDRLARRGHHHADSTGAHSDWNVRSPDPEVKKLDGKLLEHIQAEKDLIKLVAARGLGSTPRAPSGETRER